MKAFNMELLMYTPICYFSISQLYKWETNWQTFKVCVLLAGIFNERPSQPWCTFLWDVDVVLNYIKGNIPVNSEFSEKKNYLTILLFH